MVRAGWDAHNLNAPGSSSSLRPATTRPNVRARTFSPTRWLPIPPCVTRITGPAWTGNHKAPLSPQTNCAVMPAGTADDIQPPDTRNFADADTVPDADEGAVASAVHRAGREDRGRRGDPPDRDEPSDALPPPGRSRQSRTRRSDQPGPLARGHDRGAATVSDRLTVCLISRLARASARKRAYTSAETNAETSTGRHPRGRDDDGAA
jgi:hypothetical protein